MPSDENKPTSGTVRSLARGLDFLDAVVTATTPPRVTDLARQFEIDKGAAFRILRTLENAGLVEKSLEDKTYLPGSTLLRWATNLNPQAEIVTTARPYLARLVDETAASGHIGVLHNDQALLLDYLAPDTTVIVRNAVGVHEPLYATAVGKALLAFQSETRISEILQRIELVAFTKNTQTKRQRIQKTLTEVRRNAIAFDDAEYHPSLFCIASPVFTADGLVAGALGVSMVKALVIDDRNRVKSVGEAVRRCALDVTTRLGGRPNGIPHAGAG